MAIGSIWGCMYVYIWVNLFMRKIGSAEMYSTSGLVVCDKVDCRVGIWADIAHM